MATAYVTADFCSAWTRAATYRHEGQDDHGLGVARQRDHQVPAKWDLK
jgi:hypothetical protein